MYSASANITGASSSIPPHDDSRGGANKTYSPNERCGTVLSAVDPVRVFQEFATLDLYFERKIGIVAGRGSFIEAFPLFGLELDIDSIFAEKLDLLLTSARTRTCIGRKHRAALTGQGVYLRPLAEPAADLLGVGGTPSLLRSRFAISRAAARRRNHRRGAAPVPAIDRLPLRSGWCWAILPSSSKWASIR